MLQKNENKKGKGERLKVSELGGHVIKDALNSNNSNNNNNNFKEMCEAACKEETLRRESSLKDFL